MTPSDATAHARLLAVWERGQGEGVGARALTLLTALDAGPADEPALLPIGRRDALLLDLRERLFGGRYQGVTSCPSCGEEIELTFEAREVRRPAAALGSAVVQIDGIDVEFRLPNGGDLAAIENTGDIGVARAHLLARCVVKATRGGEVIAADELPPGIGEVIAVRMSALDPQADVTLDLDCPQCAHAWREPFDIVTFLWNELAVWARRLLGEVHALASAYGWNESEVLALTPARRKIYLEMVS